MSGRQDSPPISRKRRRPALSCEQCRRRKVRCDRKMPCGPCQKVYGSMDCSYVHEGKAALKARHDGNRASDNDSPPYSDLQQGTCDVHAGGAESARIAQMEGTIQALQDRVQSLEHASQNSSHNPSSQSLSIGETVLSGSTRVNDSNRDLLRQDRQAVSSRQDETRRSQTVIPPLMPRLKGSGEKTRLFGTTHWAIVFQQVTFIFYRMTGPHTKFMGIVSYSTSSTQRGHII